jgi:hypothetical protein
MFGPRRTRFGMTHSRGEWLLAAALFAGGVGSLGVGLLFRNNLTPEWLVAITMGGGAAFVIGGKLLVQAAASQYGQVQVPTWVVLLIVLALLSVLPIAALLNR